MLNSENFSIFLLLTNVICMTAESNNFEDVLKHFKSQFTLANQPEVAAVGGFLVDPSIQKYFVFSDVEISENGNDTCVSDLMYVLKHMKSKWAEEMIDADGKLSSGILRGNFLWMGDFQECSDIEVHTSVNESSHNFRGEYCIAQWNVDFPAESMQLPLKSAVCIPDSCNGTVILSDIQVLLHYLDHLPFIKNYSSLLSLEALTCKKPHQTLDSLAVGFLSFIGFFGILIILGSAITAYAYLFSRKMTKLDIQDFPYSYRRESSSSSEHEPMPGETEYYLQDDDEQIFHDGRPNFESVSQRFLSITKICSGYLSGIKSILLCFCVFTNGQKILTTEVNQDQLLCIHGIRVISMIWIILGHTYINCISVIQNAADIIENIDNFAFQVVLHGSFSVDSFFLLSGFLLTYLFLKEVEMRTSRINWPYLIIHRFWRLTPVYAVIIFYVTALFKYTGSGGFWDDVDQYQNCKPYWWWNLLYINNFLSINSMCAAWTWYLANDMQFYIITTCLLYVIWRWPKVGLPIIALLLAASWTATLYISQANSIIPIFTDFDTATNATEYSQRLYHYMDLTYSKPYCRVGPYLIGVFLAYIYYKTGRRKQFLPWWQQICGWITAIFCSLSVIYGLYHVEMENQILFDFYNAFSRSSFSLGVAWVIYTCLTGHAVIINQILSYKLWIPLSRLTYCSYLIHPVIMSWYFQSLQQPLYFTHQTVVLCFCSFLLLSYGIGFLVSLAFEAPMMKLEKLLRLRFSEN